MDKGMRYNVELSQKGDRAAFAELYSGVYTRLYRTALYILGNPHDAEDAVMETVSDAFASIRLLRDPDAFEGWIFRILYNKARRTAGSIKRVQTLELDEERACEGDELLTAAENADLRKALACLSAQERAILALCVCCDYTSEEGAKILGLNPNTLRSKQLRALKKLREKMGSDYNE